MSIAIVIAVYIATEISRHAIIYGCSHALLNILANRMSGYNKTYAAAVHLKPNHY